MIQNRISTIQHWIFDLDGTLVDSSQDLVDSVNCVRESFSLSLLSFNEIQSNIGWGIRHLLTRSVPEYADQFDFLHQQFKQIYEEHLLDKTVLFPGIKELLQNLVQENKDIFLLTNKPEYFTHKILHGLKIHDIFKEIIGGDSLPVRKPDSGTLRFLAEKHLLHPDKMLIVGDSQIDEECALAFGCAFLHLNHSSNILAEDKNYQPQKYIFSGDALQLNALLWPQK